MHQQYEAYTYVCARMCMRACTHTHRAHSYTCTLVITVFEYTHHYLCRDDDDDDVEDLPTKRQRLQGKRTINKKD